MHVTLHDMRIHNTGTHYVLSHCIFLRGVVYITR